MLSFPQQKWQVVRANAMTNARGSPRDNANLITDRLYLGNWEAAGDEKQLVELGITHVVSVLEILPDIPDIIKKDNRLHIQINDTANSDILRHLEGTTNFIKAALEADENNRIFVHCLMGISRSATVVSAYLVATKKMTGADAIAFVQKKRPIVCPNLGFRQQLDIFASRHGIQESSSEVLLSPLRQLKAWTSSLRSKRGSLQALGSTSYSLP